MPGFRLALLLLSAPVSTAPEKSSRLGRNELDAGSLAAGALSAGPLDTGPLAARALSAGPLDAGPLEAGPLGTEPRGTWSSASGRQSLSSDGWSVPPAVRDEVYVLYVLPEVAHKHIYTKTWSPHNTRKLQRLP